MRQEINSKGEKDLYLMNGFYLEVYIIFLGVVSKKLYQCNTLKDRDKLLDLISILVIFYHNKVSEITLITQTFQTKGN